MNNNVYNTFSNSVIHDQNTKVVKSILGHAVMVFTEWTEREYRCSSYSSLELVAQPKSLVLYIIHESLFRHASFISIKLFFVRGVSRDTNNKYKKGYMKHKKTNEQEKT